MDKLVLDLITQFFFDEVKYLLVTLLNKGNQVLKEVHVSEKGQELIIRIIIDSFGFESTTLQKKQKLVELFISEFLTLWNKQVPKWLSTFDVASNMNRADMDSMNDIDVNDADNNYVLSESEKNF